MNNLFKRIIYSLPHSVIYYGYKYLFNKRYQTLQKKRHKLAKPNENSFKGFDDLECIFIHIPKTGGVSLANSLFGNLGGGHRTITSYYPIFSPTEFEKYFKFTVVRNPWDRLVSAFFFLREGGFHKEDKKWFDKHLSGYESFEDFVVKWLNKRNIYTYNHFIPQIYFVTKNNKIIVDKIYKLENIILAKKDIENNLKINIELKYKNITQKRNSDYRKYYNNDTRKIVADIYSEDIQMLDYSF